MLWAISIIVVLIISVVVYDLVQRKHAILHNFPIIGHFRYILEAIGPELRQYIVTSNNEERPFSRDQRRWVYASSKKQNNYFGFGTDNNLENSIDYLLLKHSTFPIENLSTDKSYTVPSAKLLGQYRDRKHKFRPNSIVNISAMSFGSLSARAVEALNEGAKLCGCLHNTGEGGVSPYHQKGGDIIWQIGTGYFGCRDEKGLFSIDNFRKTLDENSNIKAIEIKLSQGAKPGRGGVLPAAKVSAEIAKSRGIPEGKDCISPNAHSAFQDVDSLLDFIEKLADETGLPVGIKSAVGENEFWETLADLMTKTDRGVDYIQIDGGEGGTGAAPLVFTDHVSLPFKLAFSRVYRIFAERNLHDKVVFVGSGKLGFPEEAMLAFALGCDIISVAREAMLAVGCIQAQRCHTSHCPTGVATQSKWLMSGLDPEHKAARLANYITVLRKEILWLAGACGVYHPALIQPEHFEISKGVFNSTSVNLLFGYDPDWRKAEDGLENELKKLMQAA